MTLWTSNFNKLVSNRIGFSPNMNEYSWFGAQYDKIGLMFDWLILNCLNISSYVQKFLQFYLYHP